FFDRVYDPDKYLYFNHYHFMHNHENAIFMNLQVPFTELKWMMSGEKEMAEQTFRITHSQNINRKLNFGMIYDIIFNLGQYSNQRAEDKTFTFYTSYTGSVYKLYVSAGLNGLFGQENGGIVSKEDLDVEIANTKDVPVNMGTLNDASSFLRNRNFLVVQKFTFIGAKPDRDTVPKKTIEPVPLTGTFSHIFQLDYSRRLYRDASPQSGFYDSIYIKNSETFDSLSSKFVKNTFRFDFVTDTTKIVSLSAGFGLRNENFWFSQIIPGKDTIVADTANWFRGNNVLVGSFGQKIGKMFYWHGNGELFFDRFYIRPEIWMLNSIMHYLETISILILWLFLHRIPLSLTFCRFHSERISDSGNSILFQMLWCRRAPTLTFWIFRLPQSGLQSILSMCLISKRLMAGFIPSLVQMLHTILFIIPIITCLPQEGFTGKPRMKPVNIRL
ncbi:MAG: hypothetical protein HZB98_14050, partial [Bacteroidia bacterium]|nr:hypothetical protein [Bacteroidia bacterium]